LDAFLKRLGISEVNPGAAGVEGFLETHGAVREARTPIDGSVIAKVRLATADDYERVVRGSVEAFAHWRTVPAPKRGEILREVGDALRAHKEDLGRLVSTEVGKTLSEGLGEVQEAVDMADLAVGMSRQLYGHTMHSERPAHRMSEQWHPLGVVGIITAFNFPHAVWAWNAMLASICGDTFLWKPSMKAMLTAIATHRICDEVFRRHGHPGVASLVIGEDRDVGSALIADPRIPLVSATGSTRMGRHVGRVVAERFGRTLLELGGNNAVVVHRDADLDLALRGVVFGACGTSGQRCTTTRRLFVHEDVADTFVARLRKAYAGITIGDPLEEGVLMGPLIDEQAVESYLSALDAIRAQGGEILYGGERIDRPGNFVLPTLVRARPGMPIVREETFAPILYVFTYKDLDEAIAMQNDVPQGLSSAIFTDSVRSAERFLSSMGSDCGIANVNIGTSGAEIGGAFGGEKETGGGREAGSDAWKAYMRRQTNTVNWSADLPLAQGVKFDLGE
jgi:aldehyde dehydrogenase (NAD+)